MAGLRGGQVTLGKVFSLPRKVISQLRLLKSNPEQFFLNRYHTRNPAVYERKLFDIERLVPPNIVVDAALAAHPTLNIMLPAISDSMTGGPNTAVHLAIQVAMSGIPVRLVSVDARLPANSDLLWAYFQKLTGFDAAIPTLGLACCCDPGVPLGIGVNDMFLATYWTTAYSVSHCLKLTNIKEFIYLLQDFEPAFYPWSSNYALALATYDMNYRAIINEQCLADFFCKTGTGRFSDPSFIDTSV